MVLWRGYIVRGSLVGFPGEGSGGLLGSLEGVVRGSLVGFPGEVSGGLLGSLEGIYSERFFGRVPWRR